MKSLRALQAPFLITDDELLDKIADGPLTEKLLAGLEPAGVVGLALLPEALRHPVGFGKPLVSLRDYAGARIRAPLSEVTYELLRALGAEPVDVLDTEFTHGVRSGEMRGVESELATNENLIAPGVVTGNVTFFAKLNTLVVNADRFESLTDEQQDVLGDAARATLRHVRATRLSDPDAAAEVCSGNGRVVFASGGPRDPRASRAARV